MTLREAAQQALEALDGVLDTYGEPLDLLSIAGGTYEALQCRDAITALRAALAEDAMQRLTDVQQEIEVALQSAGTPQTDRKPEPVQPVATGHIKKPYTVAEIREQIASHDYSAELLLQHAMLHLTAPPQRKPLTEEQIDELVRQNFGYITAWQGPFVRAIEKAHGITGGSDDQ